METVNDRNDKLTSIRDWVLLHPLRVDPDVRPAALDWLDSRIAETEKQPPRQATALHENFKNEVTEIIPSRRKSVKWWHRFFREEDDLIEGD